MDSAGHTSGRTNRKSKFHICINYKHRTASYRGIFSQPGTNFYLLPDQIGVLNPILILAFIPLFEVVVYPAFAKVGLLKKYKFVFSAVF